MRPPPCQELAAAEDGALAGACCGVQLGRPDAPLEEDDEALLDAVVLFFSFVLFKSASPPHELKPPKAEFEPPNIIFM